MHVLSTMSVSTAEAMLSLTTMFSPGGGGIDQSGFVNDGAPHRIEAPDGYTTEETTP